MPMQKRDHQLPELEREISGTNPRLSCAFFWRSASPGKGALGMPCIFGNYMTFFVTPDAALARVAQPRFVNHRLCPEPSQSLAPTSEASTPEPYHAFPPKPPKQTLSVRKSCLSQGPRAPAPSGGRLPDPPPRTPRGSQRGGHPIRLVPGCTVISKLWGKTSPTLSSSDPQVTPTSAGGGLRVLGHSGPVQWLWDSKGLEAHGACETCKPMPKPTTLYPFRVTPLNPNTPNPDPQTLNPITRNATTPQTCRCESERVFIIKQV